AYSYITGEKVVSYSDEQIIELIKQEYDNQRINKLAPVVRARKGHYRELIAQIAKQGNDKAGIDVETSDITQGMKVDRHKTHDIEIVIDRLQIKNNEETTKRLNETIKTAMDFGDNILMVVPHESTAGRYFSRDLMCPT